MVQVPDITITSIETLTAFDVVTKDYLFTLDELQSVSIEQSEEKTEITGKQGRRLNTLKRNKAVTISGTNGMVSHGLLERQTGSDFEAKPAEVMWCDYLTVESNAATTTFKAVGTAGAEIDNLYIRNSDGTLGTELIQDSAASTGKFAYDPATKALSFSGIADNTEIVVYYMRQINANVLVNLSDTYAGKAELYVDAIGEDKCANVYRVQFHFPKVDFDGNFTFDMGDNQTVHEFSADALSGACGTADQFFTYTVFGSSENDADVLTGIEITNAPTTTSYTVGDLFSAAGMVVTASYSQSEDKTVTNYSVAPAGALATTDTAVTVSYTEGGVTKTAVQAITVTE